MERRIISKENCNKDVRRFTKDDVMVVVSNEGYATFHDCEKMSSNLNITVEETIESMNELLKKGYLKHLHGNCFKFIKNPYDR